MQDHQRDKTQGGTLFEALRCPPGSFRGPLQESVEPLLPENALRPFACKKIAAVLLSKRGIRTREDLDRFLEPPLEDELDRAGLKRRFDAAAELILESVLSGRKAAVWCHYSADGVAAAAILKTTLKSLGLDPAIYCPDRFTEGYGLNRQGLLTLAEDGCRLLITAGCGGDCNGEIDFAGSKGMRTVAVDRHAVAAAGDSAICSAAMAFLLARACKELGLRKTPKTAELARKIDLESLAVHAAIATLAGRGPAGTLSRSLCRALFFREPLDGGEGLKALFRAARLDPSRLSSDAIRFALAPRLNAPGRMLRTGRPDRTGGELAVELLTTGDPARAKELSSLFDRLNRERREVEIRMQEAAEAKLAGRPAAAVVDWDERYHEGVCGIVAERLMERLGLPVILIAPGPEGTWKGRVSAPACAHAGNLLKACSDLLVRHGGHESAAEFSINRDSLEQLKDRLQELCEGLSPKAGMEQPLVDCELPLRVCFLLGSDLLNDLRKLEPFGPGTPKPLFLARAVRVIFLERRDSGDRRLLLREGRKTFASGVIWRRNGHTAVQEGALLDIAYRPLERYGGGSSDASAIPYSTPPDIEIEAVREAGSYPGEENG